MYAMMQCKTKSEILAHILGYQFWAVTSSSHQAEPALPEEARKLLADYEVLFLEPSELPPQ